MLHSNVNADLLITYHLMELMILNAFANTHLNSMIAKRKDVPNKIVKFVMAFQVHGHVHADPSLLNIKQS